MILFLLLFVCLLYCSYAVALPLLAQSMDARGSQCCPAAPRRSHPGPVLVRLDTACLLSLSASHSSLGPHVGTLPSVLLSVYGPISLPSETGRKLPT